MKLLFVLGLALLIPQVSAFSNCGQLVYLNYFEKLPIDKDKCNEIRGELRSVLIDAQKTYEVCKASRPSGQLQAYKVLAKKALYKHVDEAQVDKHCANSLWDVLGELDQESMDPNERDFCLKHVDIKKSVVEACRDSI